MDEIQRKLKDVRSKIYKFADQRGTSSQKKGINDE